MTTGAWSVEALAAASSSLQVIGDGSARISGITFDSRAVRPGDLFVALRGADFDGHHFLPQAIANGAAAVMVERDADCAVPRLISPNTRPDLAPVAATFYGHPSHELVTVGITGTDGKTTTAHIVDSLLRAKGHTTGMIGTVAVRIGDFVDEHASRQTTPESLDVQRLLRQMVEAGVDTAILEATSHGLDLHRLDQVRFAVGAVTNITHEHLEHHKTIAAYRRAKGILFERVAEVGGVAVVNADDEGAREMIPYAAGARVMTYSTETCDAGIVASAIDSNRDGSNFVLEFEGQREPVRLPLIGRFNLANALCAVGVSLALKVPLAEIASRLSNVPAVPGRMAPLVMGQPFSVVIDYAHTPESLAKVLELLRSLEPDGRIITVFGSAGERDTTKRPIQGRVAAELGDVVVVTDEDPRHEDPRQIIAEIAAGARAGGARDGETLFEIVDRAEAIRHALSLAKPGDQVLLAGKGHEKSIITGHEKRPWDEAAVARDALCDLGWDAV